MLGTLLDTCTRGMLTITLPASDYYTVSVAICFACLSTSMFLLGPSSLPVQQTKAKQATTKSHHAPLYLSQRIPGKSIIVVSPSLKPHTHIRMKFFSQDHLSHIFQTQFINHNKYGLHIKAGKKKSKVILSAKSLKLCLQEWMYCGTSQTKMGPLKTTSS